MPRPFAIFLCLTFPAVAAADDLPTKKLLLIGIDGCRTDALLAAHAPNLHKLAKDGAMSQSNDVVGDQSAADTVTLPGWTTMLTGVWADKHGVLDNAIRRPSRYATFFSRLRAEKSGAKTAAFVSFKAIVDHVFGDGDGARFVLDGSIKGFAQADAAVTFAAETMLLEADPTAVFVYFGQVDTAGHAFGFHPKVEQYVGAIAAVDRNVGKLTAALAKRPKYASEDWLILVATDHGGRGLGHSGGKHHEEVRRTFLILNGPSVDKTKMPAKTANVDVAATALTHLGVAIRKEWSLDGGVVGRNNK